MEVLSRLASAHEGGAPPAPLSLERYQLYDVIASGGMAQVHIGRLRASAGFARTVAIKRLHPSSTEQRELVAILADEARLAARIRHPNVVQTLDVVSHEGELFLVMEYVHGESLALIARSQSLAASKPPLEVVSAIFSGILHGLHAAHEAVSEDGKSLDIVHRDVSPQNILLGADGSARILDFGIAKAKGRLQQATHEGEIKGKLRYMSAEQLSGATVDRRTDVYAVGVVLWELLTGEVRFKGDAQEVVLEVLEASAVPPSSIGGAACSALDAIIVRAMDTRADQRFATALEMAAAIEQAVPPAAPSVVGAWVRSLVGERLDARMRRLLEIEAESGSVPRAPLATTTNAPATPAASTEVLDAGSVLMGRYRMTKQLATSEMATVWSGVHDKLHHGIAIKFLRDSASPQAATRFQREAEAMARVKSEHIVGVHDVGTTRSGTPFIVMELLAGEDLAAVVARGPVPVPEAIAYVTQACAGLAMAHALGIVHRDLKPTNLFVTRRPDGTPLVKVIDFGIAKFLFAAAETAEDIDLTKTQTLIGSPRYMAPEQVRSARTADPRTDVWALGVILYQLVTGARAFDGESTGEVLGKILFAEPVPLLELRPDLPPAFVRVVETCLKKQPDERFRDIGELVGALAAVATGGVVPVLPEAATTASALAVSRAPMSARAGTPGAGRRFVLVAAAIGLCVIAGGATIAHRVLGKAPVIAADPPPAPAPPTSAVDPAPPASSLAAATDAPGTASASPATAPSASASTARGMRGIRRPPAQPGAGAGTSGARGPRPPSTVAY